MSGGFLVVVSLLPARQALASNTIPVAVEIVRITGLVLLKEPLGFQLGRKIRAVPVQDRGLSRSGGAVPPFPRRRWIRL
jgi:hypothetical protein